MRRFLLFLLPAVVSFGIGDLKSQSIQDSCIRVYPIAFGYAYQVPGGDLSTRFGENSNIALRTGIKTAKNWQFDVHGSFIFGNNVKNKRQLLSHLRTSNGRILTANGNDATLSFFQRGFSVSLQAGKVFPVSDYNPNSGFLLKAGIGFLQHNIRIQVEENNVPQLQNDRTDYYDRRASGPMLHEFIGYQHFANNELANFFLGIELMQGFTRDRRSYNADDMSDRIQDRMDLLYGIRGGVMLPLYRQEADEDYYY